MKKHIEERAKKLADECITTGKTVRELARENFISKSTVHKDLTERLYKIDYERFKKVREVLQNNKQERAIRGGIATKRKYERLKKINRSD